MQAADAGKHVFIEKPMALTLESARSIAEAQIRNKVGINTMPVRVSQDTKMIDLLPLSGNCLDWIHAPLRTRL